MPLKTTVAKTLANVPLKRKFFTQTALVALGIIALAVIAARMQYVDLTDTRRDGLKSQIQMAIAVVDSYAERAEKGEIDVETAKKSALHTLSTMPARGGVDYIYVTDQAPVMLMHPTRPDLVGKPLSDVLSPDGKRVFPAFVTAAQAGGGSVDYTWAKPGQKDPVQKTSYAALYKPWGWVIGTGVYLRDTQSQALVFTSVVAIAGGALVLLNLLVGWMIGNSILEPVSRALAVIKGVARGDLSVRTAEQVTDEIGQMLKATDEMVHTLERFSAQTKVMVHMHAGIQTSSKKITEIISVIDGIAFQTNILALNAAMEAARAGEQGRGFAVVASEVRTLAQRSASAAKEIKHLIDDSVGKADQGSALVDQAGKTMAEIVSSVQRVTDIMSEISAASQEQSAGIAQVNLTVTQMDESTQQSAALVEEATAAANAMQQQAQQLDEAVSSFRVVAATSNQFVHASKRAPAWVALATH
ncbi:methyl-accepting chemotaxis protein [Xanthomonas prunicola]|uniref:methyl-accepting chemotaxis protein n=1 Tax=Xanthomonas prunicola TaxID=2053930 RepID=UPI002078C079|nr:methyl-accepting chemotaxis protein [Xanthomonas prunicola]USJ00614.1 methyl-accepting chemotaxis protein [Xanthomonas prunicola]